VAKAAKVAATKMESLENIILVVLKFFVLFRVDEKAGWYLMRIWEAVNLSFYTNCLPANHNTFFWTKSHRVAAQHEGRK